MKCAPETQNRVALSSISLRQACIPKEITNEQLVRVVVASIEKFPATMHENFSALARAAIVAAWPCRK
jgi:hypothetical protein